MFRMSHLGPHTYIAQDSHARGDHWHRRFDRDERHRLIEEDRAARNGVLFVLAFAMLSGMVVLVGSIAAYALGG